MWGLNDRKKGRGYFWGSIFSAVWADASWKGRVNIDTRTHMKEKSTFFGPCVQKPVTASEVGGKRGGDSNIIARTAKGHHPLTAISQKKFPK